MTSRAYVFSEWHATDLTPGVAVDLSVDGGWADLTSFYLPPIEGEDRDTQAGARSFDRVLKVAKDCGAVSAFIEYRYIDVDYRSEFNHFYGSTFRRYPSVCHRVHFFREAVDPSLNGLGGMSGAYIGYTTMRPLETSPVGRTMLPPPPQFAGASVCTARDVVHLRGHEFTVTAIPFTSQDGQYLRCSHSSLWMAATFSHLRRGTPRFLPNEIHEAASGGALVGRERPHEGLSVNQLLAAVHNLGFSGPFITFPTTKEASKQGRAQSLPAQLCRYLNGNVPVIVYNMTHAWLVIGYYFEADEDPSHDSARFIIHDDALGPYLTAAEGAPHHDPWLNTGPNKRWRGGIAVLPPKVYISGEKAELLGRERLEYLESQSGADRDEPLSFRTFLMSGVDFKASLHDRGLPDKLVELYLSLHLSRHVWVVEAIDEAESIAGKACVVGEAVIDCTANHLASAESPALLALRFENAFKSTSLDFGESQDWTFEEFPPFTRSAIPTPINPRRK